jgi:hypothetical protein
MSALRDGGAATVPPKDHALDRGAPGAKTLGVRARIIPPARLVRDNLALSLSRWRGLDRIPSGGFSSNERGLGESRSILTGKLA